MPRDLHQRALDILSSETVRLLAMVRIDFDSGTMAWHNGHDSVTYDGALYVGSGDLGDISAIGEPAQGIPPAVTISLAGINEEIVERLLAEPYVGRPAWVFLAVVGDDFVIDPELVSVAFIGEVESIDGVMGAQASFTITCQSRLSDWQRVRALRYTDADQQMIYPADKGFEFVPQMSQKKLIWPRAKFLPDPRD